MESTQMKMLQTICGKTLKDKIKSELILKMIGVEVLKKFLRNKKTKGFGQVEGMSKEKAPAMAIKIIIKGKNKARPKKQWMEVVEKDIRRRG